jgi:hypothetical protein
MCSLRMAMINTGTQRHYQISTRLAAFTRLTVSVTRLTVSGTQSRVPTNRSRVARQTHGFRDGSSRPLRLGAVDSRGSALATRKGHGRNQHDHDIEYPPRDLLVVTQQTARGTRFRHRHFARHDLANPVVGNSDINITCTLAAQIVDRQFVGAAFLVRDGLAFPIDRHCDVITADQAFIADSPNAELKRVSRCGSFHDQECGMRDRGADIGRQLDRLRRLCGPIRRCGRRGRHGR